MVAGQVTASPKNFRVGRVQACRQVTAEVNVDSSLFNHGGGSRVAVHRMTERWLFVFDQHFVVHDSTAGSINTQHRHFGAVFGCCGQPDLVAPNHRRRPAFAVNGRFPTQNGFVDRDRQICIVRMPVTGRSTKLGPIGTRKCQACQRQEPNQHDHCSHSSINL